MLRRARPSHARIGGKTTVVLLPSEFDPRDLANWLETATRVLEEHGATINNSLFSSHDSDTIAAGPCAHLRLWHTELPYREKLVARTALNQALEVKYPNTAWILSESGDNLDVLKLGWRGDAPAFSQRYESMRVKNSDLEFILEPWQDPKVMARLIANDGGAFLVKPPINSR